MRWPHPGAAVLGGSAIALAVVVLWLLAPVTADGLGVLDVGRRAVLAPGPVFAELAESGRSAAFGWWFTAGYAVLYSGTAAVLAGRGFVPITPASLPVPPRSYYARQAWFTVPVGVGATGLGCLAAWGLARLLGADIGLGPLWKPFAVALVVPTFLTMWVPETIGPFVAAPGATTDPFPVRFNAGRILAGSVWSVVLVVVAVSATGVALGPAIVAGIVGAALSGGIMAILLR